MVQMMRRKKVLVVLDDVDSTNQLEALAGDPNWYRTGSRIIITTRDEQVLIAHRVGFINNVNLLSHTEATRLFNRYAFTKETPIQGHKELSRQVVKYAHGLPLTIKVLGSLLCDGKLWMHDHIEEMGMNIVGRANPKKPETHSRLWIKKEIVDVLANESATRATKCITLDAEGLNFDMLMKGLANMKELRFLHVLPSIVWENQVGNWNFPYALQFLRWDYYPFSSLPKTFQVKNLVGLQMISGKMEQLWKDGEEKDFPKLRFLNFIGSWFLRTLDLSVVPNLETLILKDCSNLVEVDFEVRKKKWWWKLGGKKMLVKEEKATRATKCITLDAEGLNFEMLMKVLRNLHLGITPNLETLRLRDCAYMVELHMPAKCPKLINLDLCSLVLRNLHLGITPNLETLRLRDCAYMVELHMPAKCPKLVNLDLCSLKLRTLHLGITPNLKRLAA
nr:hypothetical protein [Tanacetum cinerariifolium]